MNRKTEVTAMENQYRQLIKPALESMRANLDAHRNPVKVALLDAYMERFEVLVFGHSVGDAARKEIREFNELAPWVNPKVEISADRAHSGPIGKTMLAAGCEYPEVYKTLETARKRKRGRPVALRAIEALEMSLAGKSNREIAETLSDGEVHVEDPKDRFRKEIAKLRALYEKYKPRK